MKKIVRGLVTKNTPVLELELLIITKVQIDATKIKLLVVSGMLLLNNKQMKIYVFSKKSNCFHVFDIQKLYGKIKVASKIIS